MSHSDMALVRPKLHLLNFLAGKTSTEEAQRMNEACNELAARAQMALDQQPSDKGPDLATLLAKEFEPSWQLLLQESSEAYQSQASLGEMNAVLSVRQTNAVMTIPANYAQDPMQQPLTYTGPNLMASNTQPWMQDPFF
jgi:hypothetical protein